MTTNWREEAFAAGEDSKAALRDVEREVLREEAAVLRQHQRAGEFPPAELRRIAETRCVNNPRAKAANARYSDCLNRATAYGLLALLERLG